VKTFTGLGISLSLVLGIVVGRGLAQDEKKQSSNEPPVERSAQASLARLAGRFDAAFKVWSDPTSAPREGSGRIENKLVHGGRFLLSDYAGRLGDKPYTATNLLGYDETTKRYTNVCVDSMGPSIEVATGTGDAAGKTLTLEASESGLTWIFRLEDDDHYSLELHAGHPGGKDVMFFQVVYTRAKASDGDVSAKKRPEIGSIAWRDLTVADAASVRTFYGDVVGWKSAEIDMGGYADFAMATPGSGEVVAGICHARGANAKLPAQWLLYITVADVDRSARRCVELGGKILDGPKAAGGQRYCVIQDPAGAVAALVGK
jgi:predicted enzyme related to lactoylglutathione lyase